MSDIVILSARESGRTFLARMGYEERARRAMVKGAWQTTAREWVLMIKPRKLAPES